ncbi:MAG: hypothetical protein ABJH52_07510 [Henriciella sp.]
MMRNFALALAALAITGAASADKTEITSSGVQYTVPNEGGWEYVPFADVIEIVESHQFLEEIERHIDGARLSYENASRIYMIEKKSGDKQVGHISFSIVPSEPSFLVTQNEFDADMRAPDLRDHFEHVIEQDAYATVTALPRTELYSRASLVNSGVAQYGPWKCMTILADVTLSHGPSPYYFSATCPSGQFMLQFAVFADKVHLNSVMATFESAVSSIDVSQADWHGARDQ